MSEPSINALKSHARSPLPLGHVVGGLRLLAVLGGGRFGLAYLAAAVDANSGEQRHVVLREYMPAGLATRRSDSYAVRPLRGADRPDFDWGLARLRQEAEALSALEHTSLARVLGLIEENGTGYCWPTEESHGCGCRAGDGSAAGLPGLLLLALLALRRRRKI